MATDGPRCDVVTVWRTGWATGQVKSVREPCHRRAVEGFSRCRWHEEAFQCEGLVFWLDKKRKPRRTRCGARIVNGSTRCRRHADPSYVSKAERSHLDGLKRTRERKRNAWTVKRLAKLPENRQLDLFVWAEAYEREYLPTMRRMLDGEREPDYPGSDASESERQRFWSEIEWRERYERRFGNFGARLHAACVAQAERQVLDHGMPSWGMMRRLIYERDGGVCFVCGDDVPWEYYHLGHLQDRCAGGSDHPNNLVVMCNVCNMDQKPVHDTREEAIAWAEACRAWNERLRVMRCARQMSEDEVLAAWAELDDEQREEVVRNAIGWGHEIEQARRQLSGSIRP